MAHNPNFEQARRRLDASMRSLESEPAAAIPEPTQPDKPQRLNGRRRRAPLKLQPVHLAAAPEPPPDAYVPAPPMSAALTRLLVGALLLGLEYLEQRAGRWSSRAGIRPARPAAPARPNAIGGGRFRDALIGWIFETEEQLRPQGNPISWLRRVVRYLFGTVFAVVLEMLPLPRLSLRRNSASLTEPADEDTQRLIQRGQAEGPRSRLFARTAINDTTDELIDYLARRPAVGRALSHIVRTPAMDDAVRTIVDGPVVEQAIKQVAASPALNEVIAKVGQSPALDEVIAKVGQSPALEATVQRVVQSPAMDQAVQHIVRSPAMEDAIRYLVQTRAMDEALDTLAHSPALVELVTTQSTSVVGEIIEEIRAHTISADMLAESLARRLLRRPPRALLPAEAQGLRVVVEPPAELPVEVRPE